MKRSAILFSSHIDSPKSWQEVVSREIPDLDFRIFPEAGNLDEIKYALVWSTPNGTLRKLKNLEAVFSLGAGVDQILRDPEFPKEVPLYRLVDAGLRAQMTQYAVYGALHWHRCMGTYREQQLRHEWKMLTAVHPSDVTIGVMGLGIFGSDIAEKLSIMGFRVVGWSRSPKDLPNVKAYAGNSALGEFLGQSQILVNVLPLTDETRGMLSASLFEKLPQGSALIHMGRGGQLNIEDLLNALDTHRLVGATLDVFPIEPIDPNSKLWDHPRVVITPHIASQAAGSMAENHVINTLRAFMEGREPEGRVDPSIGY
jgi:glyoxylate/hydroxypyruvate reductase A